jgi:hypothetical protein
MKEEAVLFGARRSLAGIVTEPVIAGSARATKAVILLNAGIVHRVGPGRIYVKIARELAAMGFVVLRFDFSGIGDSAARHDHLSFDKSAVAEAQEAMEFLNATRGIEQYLFLGGCSGALASLETACCDPRVTGAILINFQTADSEDEVAPSDLPTRKAAHYYWKYALFDPKSWRKLLTGGTNYGQVVRVLRLELERRLKFRKREPRKATRLEACLRSLAARRVRIVFVCSDGDPRLRDLREAGGQTLKQLCASGAIVLDVIRGADHTFSSVDDQKRLLRVICQRINAMRYHASIRPDVITCSEETPSCQFLQPSSGDAGWNESPQGGDL